VACPEEPYDHPLEPGDVEIRFKPLGPFDVCGLDVVIEVRSRWFPSRAEDRQRRCDALRNSLTASVNVAGIGVYLSLPVAAWAQT
jgi:hypothetical protein